MNPRLWLVAALCCTLFMPSDDSIWIDEAQTAAYARQPSLSAWVDRIAHDRFSEAQMPLGMFLAWLSARVLGTGEWQLRAPNIIWAATFIWVAWRIGCRFGLPALALLAAVQPFLWFYTNEARPYALQLAGGALLLLSGVHLLAGGRDPLRGILLWALSGIMLCASTMLGVIPFAIATVWLGVVLVRRRIRVRAAVIVVISATVLLLGILGVYYLQTLKRGAGGATLWPVSLNNLLFAAYELLGFTGLGPARHALRNAFATHAVLPVVAPFILPLAIFGLTGAVVFGLALRRLSDEDERHFFRFFLIVPLLSALALFLLARSVHFPFWGRHLSPILVFLTVALGLSALRARESIARTTCAIWIVLCLLSSLEVRFARRHKKDDNRSAARIALHTAAEGKRVWWCADERCGHYYGIRFADAGADQGIILVGAESDDAFRQLAIPDLVFVSKPETFDPSGRVTAFVQREGYKLTYVPQAMAGWVKP